MGVKYHAEEQEKCQSCTYKEYKCLDTDALENNLFAI